jgi:hypothetical protein
MTRGSESTKDKLEVGAGSIDKCLGGELRGRDSLCDVSCSNYLQSAGEHCNPVQVLVKERTGFALEFRIVIGGDFLVDAVGHIVQGSQKIRGILPGTLQRITGEARLHGVYLAGLLAAKGVHCKTPAKAKRVGPHAVDGPVLALVRLHRHWLLQHLRFLLHDI